MALALGTRQSTIAAVASALAAIALAVAVAGGSCRVALPGPEVAVHDLFRAAQAGDRDAIFELLTPTTQKLLGTKAQRAIDLNGASVRYAPKDMISIGSPTAGSSPTEIRVIEQRGDRAVVEIVASDGTFRLHLEKWDGKWRVALPDYGR